jgi:hypothetical protein
MLHRQTLSSRNMREELQIEFQAVIRVVNYVKNSPLRGRLVSKLRDDTEAANMALLYYFKRAGNLVPKCLKILFRNWHIL